MPYKDPAVREARRLAKIAAETPEQRQARLDAKKAYREANKERIKEESKRYYEKHKAERNPQAVARAKQWAKEHPEEAKKRRRDQYYLQQAKRLLDPEFDALCRERKRNYRQTPWGAVAHKRSSLKTLGWSLERYTQYFFEIQKEKCAICGRSFDKEKPCADHKHVDPPIPRGLLCNGCNSGLGFFRESIETLEKAIEYLRKFS